MGKETAVLQPELGGQPVAATMKSEAQHVKDAEHDLKVISAFLDRFEKELHSLRETLKSDDLKVVNFRNWVAYEFADLRLQRESLK